MKLAFVFIFGFLLGSSVYAQEPDCTKFIDGTFYYPSSPGTLSIRNGSKQESVKGGVVEMVWKVKWLNECEYTLTCKKVKKGVPMFKKGDKINVKIVATDGDCFTCTLIFYNKENPDGQVITGGRMCKKVDQ